MMTELDKRVTAAAAAVNQSAFGASQRAADEAAAAYRSEIGEEAFDMQLIRSAYIYRMPMAEMLRAMVRIQLRLVETAGLK